MSSTAPATAAGQDGVRLRRNALSLRHIVASTLANIAPAMSFFFGFAVIVEGAGLAAPLTMLTGRAVIPRPSAGSRRHAAWRPPRRSSSRRSWSTRIRKRRKRS